MIVKLNYNLETIIDDDCFELVSKYHWYADFDKKLGKYYAKTTSRVGGKRMNLRMHRLIMNAKKWQVVDHVNRDTLDNRTFNLRLCSVRDNTKNRSLNKNNTSWYKGVVWHTQVKKWQSRLSFHGKWISLWLFDDKIEAAKAYNLAAISHYWEFAKLNPI